MSNTLVSIEGSVTNDAKHILWFTIASRKTPVKTSFSVDAGDWTKSVPIGKIVDVVGILHENSLQVVVYAGPFQVWTGTFDLTTDLKPVPVRGYVRQLGLTVDVTITFTPGS